MNDAIWCNELWPVRRSERGAPAFICGLTDRSYPESYATKIRQNQSYFRKHSSYISFHTPLGL